MARQTTSAASPIPPDQPTERGVELAKNANVPSTEDNSVPGGEQRPVKPSPALYVTEGTRQELLAGARAYDYGSGRELTLDGETVRFATEAETEERDRAAGRLGGNVSTTDVESLNPS